MEWGRRCEADVRNDHSCAPDERVLGLRQPRVQPLRRDVRRGRQQDPIPAGKARCQAQARRNHGGQRTGWNGNRRGSRRTRGRNRRTARPLKRTDVSGLDGASFSPEEMHQAMDTEASLDPTERCRTRTGSN
eukprot:scaffold287_cov337-Pavlova_lutheri.AAC.248